MAVIYKIINKKNNKIYIGKTIKKVEELISKRISIASKKMWEKMPDEKHLEICNQRRNSALQQHKRYSEEDKLRIYEKISISQKGKGFYKNVNTGEIKLITPKNFCYYDFENIWKKCHRDGTLWEN